MIIRALVWYSSWIWVYWWIKKITN